MALNVATRSVWQGIVTIAAVGLVAGSYQYVNAFDVNGRDFIIIAFAIVLGIILLAASK